MRSYLDIDTFSEWTNEEQNQFALSVTKGLIIDMVRKANSGHSGGPMSSADFSQILFTEYLNFDPSDPEWFNRDRFVLSAGHESALIYAILTQLGWLNIDDLQKSIKFKDKVFTEVKKLDIFHEAEDYHKNYYNMNKNSSYCSFTITPKVTKFMDRYKEMLRKIT